MVKRWWLWLREAVWPVAPPPKPPSDTAKLYVLKTDFPVGKELGDKIQTMLDPLRKEFGLTFLVIEPGITLSKFDDI
jgi:hypothetical protein